MRKGIVLLMSCALAGCSTNAGTGALVGAGLGVGAGALIDGGAGALIGGAVGAAAGGLVGSAMDAQERERLARDNPQTLNRVDNEQQLSVQDVINMSNANVHPDTIIALIKKTHSQFYLTSHDVIRMKKAGVDQKVIDYMVNN